MKYKDRRVGSTVDIAWISLLIDCSVEIGRRRPRRIGRSRRSGCRLTSSAAPTSIDFLPETRRDWSINRRKRTHHNPGPRCRSARATDTEPSPSLLLTLCALPATFPFLCSRPFRGRIPRHVRIPHLRSITRTLRAAFCILVLLFAFRR